MKKFISFFICLLLCSCARPQVKSILAADFPEVKNGDILINVDTDESVYIEVKGFTQNEFIEYRDECMNSGLNIDADVNDSFLYAFNDKHEWIQLIYDRDSQYCSITFHESKVQYDLDWKETPLLPNPNCTNGKIEKFSNQSIEAYLKMDKKEFDQYVKTCKKFGFHSLSNKDNYYYGSDDAGNNLYLTYMGGQTVSLSLVIQSA